jgi:hypothetical protein
MGATATARPNSVAEARDRARAWFTTAPDWAIAVHMDIDLPGLTLPVVINRAGTVKDAR